jgi:hypothetical protein
LVLYRRKTVGAKAARRTLVKLTPDRKFSLPQIEVEKKRHFVREKKVAFKTVFFQLAFLFNN